MACGEWTKHPPALKRAMNVATSDALGLTVPRPLPLRADGLA
jgi:hypothetical protein